MTTWVLLPPKQIALGSAILVGLHRPWGRSCAHSAARGLPVSQITMARGTVSNVGPLGPLAMQERSKAVNKVRALKIGPQSNSHGDG